MGKLKDLYLMNDIEVEGDTLGGYTVHDTDCSCAILDTYQPVSRDKEIEVDWEYGERYNAAGEWNPRLVYSEKTGEYVEPEEIEEGE